MRGRRRLTVASRLAVAVIGTGAVAVGVTSLVGLRYGEWAADRVVDRRLTAVLGGEQVEIGGHLEGMRSAVGMVAASPMAVDAVQEFSAGFSEVEVPDAPALDIERAELLAHYREVVAPAIAAAEGREIDARRLLPRTGAGVHLQYASFLGDAVFEEVAGADTWSAALGRFDPIYRDVARRLEAEELVLVDRRGTVVHAVNRSPDFATNLLVGPHSGQVLSTIVRQILAGRITEPVISDLVAYGPALGRPVWFVVAPVVDGGVVVGALAVRWPVDSLNEPLASAVDGREGFGDTGEVYLAGADGRLRSDPRAFRESPSRYLDDALAAGTLTQQQADQARARGTVALLQRADGDAVAAGLAGDSAVVRRTDHLGRQALVTQGTVEADGSGWVLMAQMTVDEIEQPGEDYRRLLLVAATVLVSLLTFAAASWSRWLLRPVREIAERLRRNATTTGATDGPLPPIISTCDDFTQLAAQFEAMQLTLEERRAAVARTHDEHRELLRSLLPPAVASRVDAGDRSFVERVPSASVIVLTLEEEVDRDGQSVRRQLDRILAMIDEAGREHGVDRVKLVGDGVFCAVGLQRPLLDHARRAVAFARDVVEAAAGFDRSVAIAVGVSSGPVNVGLGGSHHLLLDIWGSTVDEAYVLSRRAAPGEVGIAAATSSRLPAGVDGGGGS